MQEHDSFDRFACGCERRVWDGAWRLCQYHEGYDDGVEAALSSTSPSEEVRRG